MDFFSSLMVRAYSRMTMPQFIRLKLWKSCSGSMRHSFSHMDWPSQCADLNPTENLLGWDGEDAEVWLSHHQYKILVKIECNSGLEYVLRHCINVSKRCHGERELYSKLKVAQRNIRVCVRQRVSKHFTETGGPDGGILCVREELTSTKTQNVHMVSSLAANEDTQWRHHSFHCALILLYILTL